jgi:hypothetical protein
VPLPDARKLMHVFPISAGVETTADGDTLNAVAEIGYVPFKFGGVRRLGENDLRLGINPRFGIFLQGGQKIREAARDETGGARDDSAEQEGKAIGGPQIRGGDAASLPYAPLQREHGPPRGAERHRLVRRRQCRVLLFAEAILGRRAARQR